jgi:hypothetical protein
MNGLDAIIEVRFLSKEIFEIVPETFIEITRSMQTTFSSNNQL